MKLDLNGTSIAGMVFVGVALLLRLRDASAEAIWTVGTVLGDGAPFARVHLWMVAAFVGLVVYLVGRAIWLVGHYRENLGVPPRRDDP